MDDFENYISKSFEADEANNTYDAIEYLQLALAIDATHAIQWARLGYFQRDVELFDAAMDSFKRAMTIDPELPFAYTGMGGVAEHKGDYDVAEKYYQKSVDLEPKAFRYVFLGSMQQCLNKIEQAEHSFMEALRIDPKDEEAMYNLAFIFKDQGKHQVAIPLFKKAIEIDPQYTLAYRELGVSLRALGEMKEAERCMRKAIALHDTDFWTHLYLGELLEFQENIQEAENEYIRACELAPTEPFPLITLGSMHASQDNIIEAEKNYRRAVELDENDAHSCYKLALFLIGFGDMDEGEQWLDKALEIEPDHEKALLLRESLSEPDDPEY